MNIRNQKIKSKNGYAVGVRCGGWHSGSHRLAVDSDRLYAECEGCRTYYSADAILSPADRELGVRGVIRAD